MGIRRITTDNRTASINEALDCAAESLASGRRPVILVDDGRSKRMVNDLAAGRGRGFGVTVGLPAQFFEEQWVLHGDGRRMISDSELDFLALGAIKELKELPVFCSYAQMACDVLARYGGAAAVKAADADALPENAAAMVRAMDRCLEVLGREGLVLLPDAVLQLCGTPAFSQVDLILIDEYRGAPWLSRSLDTLEESGCGVTVLVDGCLGSAQAVGGSGRELSDLLAALPFEGKPAGPTVERRGQVRLELPAGPAAADAALMEAINREVAAARSEAEAAQKPALPVLVVMKDPVGAFRRLAPALNASGIGAAVEGRMCLNDTTVCRAFRCLLSTWSTHSSAVSHWVDFALNPCSGFSRESALSQDAWIRKNPAVTKRLLFTQLAPESETLQAAITALSAGSLAECAAVLGDRGRAVVLPQADAAQTTLFLNADAALRDLMALADGRNLEYREVEGFLDRASIPYKASYGDQVRFAALPQAAAFGPGAFHSVIMWDMTSDGFPAPAVQRPVDALLEALGIPVDDRGITRQRCQVFNALDAARHRVVLGRCRLGADAAAVYSATTLEEILDCYRPDPTDQHTLDKDGFPKVFTEENVFGTLKIPGEDEMLVRLKPESDLDCASVVRQPGVTLSVPGEIGTSDPGLLLLRGQQTLMSASQIESYLTCPYKWFTERRINANPLATEFGPILIGEFVHKVMRRFYAQVKDGGLLRVTPENLAESTALLEEVFAAVLAGDSENAGNWTFREFSKKPGAPVDFLVSKDPFQDDKVRRILEDLKHSLALQASLYPGFAPAQLEYRFGYDTPVTYAGMQVVGSVDRIDMDGEGHAIVWDYKGSVKKHYTVGASIPVLPDIIRLPAPEGGDGTVSVRLPLKVQALIYAQVVRRLLDVEPVAALYLSYGHSAKSDKPVAGAYAPRFAPVESLTWFGSQLPAGVATFPELLDRTEEDIALVLEQLKAGNYPPSPRGLPKKDGDGDEGFASGTDPCRYCAAVNCPQRKGAGYGSF